MSLRVLRARLEERSRACLSLRARRGHAFEDVEGRAQSRVRHVLVARARVCRERVCRERRLVLGARARARGLRTISRLRREQGTAEGVCGENAVSHLGRRGRGRGRRECHRVKARARVSRTPSRAQGDGEDGGVDLRRARARALRTVLRSDKKKGGQMDKKVRTFFSSARSSQY
jgi:hypothetical protein